MLNLTLIGDKMCEDPDGFGLGTQQKLDPYICEKM